MSAHMSLKLSEGSTDEYTQRTLKPFGFLKGMFVHNSVAIAFASGASSVNMSLRCTFVLQNSITEETLICSAQEVCNSKSVMFLRV